MIDDATSEGVADAGNAAKWKVIVDDATRELQQLRSDIQPGVKRKSNDLASSSVERQNTTGS